MSVSAVSGGNSAWYTQAQSQPAQPGMNNTAEPFSISTSQPDQDPNIANGTAPAGGHHGGHHHRVDMTDTAQLLGLSTSQLDQDVQSGTTLSSLASQDGVSSSSLISSIESDLQSNAPQGAPALSSDQLTQIATNIANGTPPAPAAGQDQAGASQLNPGQSLASVLAADAYSNSATELASSTSAGNQISEYS